MAIFNSYVSLREGIWKSIFTTNMVESQYQSSTMPDAGDVACGWKSIFATSSWISIFIHETSLNIQHPLAENVMLCEMPQTSNRKFSISLAGPPGWHIYPGKL